MRSLFSSSPAGSVTARAPGLGRSVVATSFGFAMVQLDVTIVNVALPAMGADLGAGTAGLQWIVDAYALVFAALLLTAGYGSDILGARRVYLGGLALFALASLACGLAPGTATMVVARAVQGLGAAAMLPSSLALLNHACGDDARHRGWAIGWWTSTASAAMACGPIVGGVLIHLTGWRAIFLVNLPLSVLAAVLLRRLPETTLRGGRRIDGLGQVLGAGGLAALTGAVIEAGPRGLGDPLVPALGGLAVALIVLFVRHERRHSDPMLPGRMFAAPMVTLSMVFGAAVNFTYYGTLFVLSLYLQRGLGFDALHAGLAFLPLTVTFLAVNALSGWVSGRFGARVPMLVGGAVAALGYALLLPLRDGSGMVAMLPGFVLIPAGMGFAVPAMIAGVLAAVDRGMSGTVSAALNAARQAGGVIGVAVFGALASASVLAGLHAAASISAGLLIAMVAVTALVLRRRA